MIKSACVTAVLLIHAVFSFSQVGIGTTTPNSMLDVRGSMSTAFRSNLTGGILATDHTNIYTGTTAASANLPTAIGCTGRMYWIKNASTTSPTPVLTINTVSSQTIDGASSWVLDEPNEIVCFVSNGTNWYVLNQDAAVAKTSTVGGAWLQGGNKNTSVKSLGTTTNFDLPFIANNIERMRLNTTGYLGIGTTSPQARIHTVNQGIELGDDYLFDDYGTGTTQGIYMSKSRGSIASPSDLINGDQIGYFRFVPRYNGTMGVGPGSSFEAYYKGTGTNELTDLRFNTSNTEKMRITETGNVGIGATNFSTTAPEKLLVDAGTTTSFNVISGKGTINNYLQLNIQNRSDGTSASSDIVATADNGNESSGFVDMGINSSGYNSTGILGGVNTAYLYATGRDFVIGNGTSTGNRNLIFFTNGFNTTDEKLRILSTGNIGIGTTAPADKLSVAGNIAPSADNLYSAGKSGARWSAVWSTNGVIQTSDARMKTNIKDLNYGLKEVMAMRPVRYNWKTTPNGDNKIGLIAQEVQQIVPEVVSGDVNTETLGMNYAELIPVLINAVQEQQKEIEAIEKQINHLRKK
jgi:hypothetical protein